MSLTGEGTTARRDRLGSDWRGIYCILVTPFNDDYSVDWAGLRTNVEFIAGAPVDVVVCLGTGGEPYALADDERRAIVEVVAEELRGRRPLMVGVSHSSTLASAQLARHARENGCDAVLTTAPYYIEMDSDRLQRHLGAVADAGAPTFFYNVPQRVAYDPSPDEILDLADRIPLAGIKESSLVPALGRLLANRHRQEFVVIGGRETTIWQSLIAGADGNTSTAASALPKTFATLWDASQREDQGSGKLLFDELEPLRRAYAIGGGQVTVTKRLLELRGLAGGPPRPPLVPADSRVDALLRLVLAAHPL
jgi:4-hydroxy-tetrahydrodipicolinate synthase